MEAKILIWDTEVSRSVVEGYGTKWDFKVVKFVRQQELMCYAYKWLGEKKTHFVSRHDFKTYTGFIQSLADLLNSADISIAHNGLGFDDKMANTFFIQERIPPPAPRKSIDTLQVARRVFKFPSNSLRDLADFLNLGDKEKITYAELEDDFMSKRPSMRTKMLMSRYNRKDVELLEKIYLVLRPYIKNHPNLTVYNGAFACPKCQSHDLQRRGVYVTNTMTYQRLWCKDCKAWSRERLAEKEADKPELVGT